jgi:tetratricopeptide (TPR) repeat protein
MVAAVTSSGLPSPPFNGRDTLPEARPPAADTVTPRGQDPYPGPRSYRSDESARFFGRDNDASKIAALWRSQRLTVLHGRAGAGKTSLVQAGVMRLVSQPGVEILPVASLASSSRFSAVPLSEHNPFLFTVLAGWAPLEDPVRLSRMTASGFISERARTIGARTVLAVIDQAEELFRRPAGGGSYSDEFIDQLVDALRDHSELHVLLVIRDDQLAEFLSDGRLTAGARVMLRYLDRQAAADAIRGPAAGTGRSFAPGVAEELIDVLLNATPGSASGPKPTHGNRAADSEGGADFDDGIPPTMLQVAVARLWNALPSGTTTISMAELWRLADVDRWTAEFIGDAVRAVSRYREVNPWQVSSWLVQSFIDSSGARATVPVEREAVAGMPIPVCFAFEDRHILRAVVRSGVPWWELASSRMIGPLQIAGETVAKILRAAMHPGPAAWLGDAEVAFGRGEFDLAWRHAQRAIALSTPTDIRGLAKAETLLGNIAYQRHAIRQARTHYRNASRLFEVAKDRPAVGRLLAAIGRLELADHDVTAALVTLQSAARRLPRDLRVREDLARAFAAAGAGPAATAVASSVPDTGTAEQISEAESPHYDNGPMLLRAAQIRALRGDRGGAAHLAERAISATEISLSQFQRRLATGLQKERGA